MIRVALIYLPAFVLIVGWLTGLIQARRTAIFFWCWIAVALVLTSVATFHMLEVEGLFWGLGAAVFTLLALPAALIFGLLTSKPVTPAPMDGVVEAVQTAGVKVYDAYEKLPPQTKTKVSRAARFLAKLGLRHLSDKVEEQGYQKTAQAFREATRIFL